jgi:hypothetical protein
MADNNIKYSLDNGKIYANSNLLYLANSKYQYIDWGNGKITRGRWMLIKKVLKDYNIKSVIEFGSGLSSELFSLEQDLEVWSLDILKQHIENMKLRFPKIKFIHYEKENLPEIDRVFDMAFVDGPAGYRHKELSLARDVATKVLICDDWKRNQEVVDLDEKWNVVIKNIMWEHK